MMNRSASRLHSLVRLAVVGSLLMCSVGAARAQDAVVEPPPPPIPPPPPSYYYVPAPAPYYVPPPPRLTIDPVELEQRGHRKKVAGAVLMGLGVGLTAVGIGFGIHGALHAECHGHEEHATCTPSAATTEMQLGTTGAVVGTVMAIAGIPVYIVGGAQVAKARRLSALSLQPLVSSAGAGAVARAEVRF
jgi:hypothetical protein